MGPDRLNQQPVMHDHGPERDALVGDESYDITDGVEGLGSAVEALMGIVDPELDYNVIRLLM